MTSDIMLLTPLQLISQLPKLLLDNDTAIHTTNSIFQRILCLTDDKQQIELILYNYIQHVYGSIDIISIIIDYIPLLNESILLYFIHLLPQLFITSHSNTPNNTINDAIYTEQYDELINKLIMLYAELLNNPSMSPHIVHILTSMNELPLPQQVKPELIKVTIQCINDNISSIDDIPNIIKILINNIDKHNIIHITNIIRQQCSKLSTNIIVSITDTIYNVIAYNTTIAQYWIDTVKLCSSVDVLDTLLCVRLIEHSRHSRAVQHALLQSIQTCKLRLNVLYQIIYNNTNQTINNNIVVLCRVLLSNEHSTDIHYSWAINILLTLYNNHHQLRDAIQHIAFTVACKCHHFNPTQRYRLLKQADIASYILYKLCNSNTYVDRLLPYLQECIQYNDNVTTSIYQRIAYVCSYIAIMSGSGRDALSVFIQKSTCSPKYNIRQAGVICAVQLLYVSYQHTNTINTNELDKLINMLIKTIQFCMPQVDGNKLHTSKHHTTTRQSFTSLSTTQQQRICTATLICKYIDYLLPHMNQSMSNRCGEQLLHILHRLDITPSNKQVDTNPLYHISILEYVNNNRANEFDGTYIQLLSSLYSCMLSIQQRQSIEFDVNQLQFDITDKSIDTMTLVELTKYTCTQICVYTVYCTIVNYYNQQNQSITLDQFMNVILYRSSVAQCIKQIKLSERKQRDNIKSTNIQNITVSDRMTELLDYTPKIEFNVLTTMLSELHIEHSTHGANLSSTHLEQWYTLITMINSILHPNKSIQSMWHYCDIQNIDYSIYDIYPVETNNQSSSSSSSSTAIQSINQHELYTPQFATLARNIMSSINYLNATESKHDMTYQMLSTETTIQQLYTLQYIIQYMYTTQYDISDTTGLQLILSAMCEHIGSIDKHNIKLMLHTVRNVLSTVCKSTEHSHIAVIILQLITQLSYIDNTMGIVGKLALSIPFNLYPDTALYHTNEFNTQYMSIISYTNKHTLLYVTNTIHKQEKLLPLFQRCCNNLLSILNKRSKTDYYIYTTLLSYQYNSTTHISQYTEYLCTSIESLLSDHQSNKHINHTLSHHELVTLTTHTVSYYYDILLRTVLLLLCRSSLHTPIQHTNNFTRIILLLSHCVTLYLRAYNVSHQQSPIKTKHKKRKYERDSSTSPVKCTINPFLSNSSNVNKQDNVRNKLLHSINTSVLIIRLKLIQLFHHTDNTNILPTLQSILNYIYICKQCTNIITTRYKTDRTLNSTIKHITKLQQYIIVQIKHYELNDVIIDIKSVELTELVHYDISQFEYHESIYNDDSASESAVSTDYDDTVSEHDDNQSVNSIDNDNDSNQSNDSVDGDDSVDNSDSEDLSDVENQSKYSNLHNYTVINNDDSDSDQSIDLNRFNALVDDNTIDTKITTQIIPSI